MSDSEKQPTTPLEILTQALRDTDHDQDPEWNYEPQARAILDIINNAGCRIIGPADAESA